jgi:type I restriction enzyme S subunit
LNGGPFGSELVRRDYVDSGVPVIRGVNLSGDTRFNDNDFVFVSERKADELRANNAQSGDVIFTQRGTLGQVGLIPHKASFARYVISQSQMKMTVDESLVLPEWIYYFFTAPLTVNELVNKAFSSGVPHINLGILRELRVPVPPLPTQLKICTILSAYDDLIENNLRRIEILEEMAQNLYREWFVRLRFPGHEGARMVDSPMGRIPEGWEAARIGSVATICRGRSYRGSDLAEKGGVPFLNLKCIDRGGGFRYDGIKRYLGPFKQTQTASVGDIIIAVTDVTQKRRLVAHAARVPVLDEPVSVLSMDLVRLSPAQTVAREYLYGMLRYSAFADEVKQHANGVNVLHLNPERIATFEFVLPTPELVTRYSTLCASLYQECDILHLKNANLRGTRDLLLPKLISGEVAVESIGDGP